MSQTTLNLDPSVTNVDSFEFEQQPIKGYPTLYWRGKRPFRSTNYYPAQHKETHGDEVKGWLNQIFWGDNLQVMSHLLKKFRGQINLIYIDPPFDSKADYKKKITVKGKEYKNDSTCFEEKQYSDLWTNDEYLQFMYERIILLKELLAPEGSLFLHCDRHKSHHLRCILDEVFGNKVEENAPGLVNEIIWFYPDSPGRPQDRFAPKHDVIFWYAKSSKYTFNADAVREPILEASKKRYESTRYLINSQGKRFEYQGGTSSEAGKIPETVWRMSVVKGNAKQATDYPTQKPEQLLERIILAASNPGDLVFDGFMGSGTTLISAMRLGRKFIGADINLGSIQTTTKRLIEVVNGLTDSKDIFENELPPIFTGFAVHNVNHYDIFRNPAQAKELLIEALEIQPMPAGNVFDGEQDGHMVKIMPVDRIATKADLRELVMNIDQKEWMRRREELGPNKPVEHILLVCMGHDPDLAAELQRELSDFKLKIEVVDILRDRADLEFKRDAEAKITRQGDKLVIEKFYPLNLLQKLSLQKEKADNWRELVESVMVDFNYDGAVLQPTVVDIPANAADLVRGEYPIPANAGTIRVKITDLLSESLEVTLPAHG
jgi:adenine-specific DNA-methyltransferase